jgi:hypothetical protein
MFVVEETYRFIDVSWVADPPDRNARVRLTLWQTVSLWAFCTLLSVRHWWRGKIR